MVPLSHLHIAPLPWPKIEYVAALSIVSVLDGSKITRNASAPRFKTTYCQPERVELHAGKFSVISAVNVPI